MLRAFGELPAEYIQQNGVEDIALESDCYVRIERVPSHKAFQFMTDFVSEVRDSRVSEALRSAVVGHQPFRRFKDALSNFPKEGERWFQYEGLRRRNYIQEWAREAGVESDFNADAS